MEGDRRSDLELVFLAVPVSSAISALAQNPIGLHSLPLLLSGQHFLGDIEEAIAASWMPVCIIWVCCL